MDENKKFLEEFDRNNEDGSIDVNNIYLTDSFYNQKRIDYQSTKTQCDVSTGNEVVKKEKREEAKPVVKNDDGVSYEQKFKMIMKKYRDQNRE